MVDEFYRFEFDDEKHTAKKRTVFWANNMIFIQFSKNLCF